MEEHFYAPRARPQRLRLSYRTVNADRETLLHPVVLGARTDAVGDPGAGPLGRLTETLDRRLRPGRSAGSITQEGRRLAGSPRHADGRTRGVTRPPRGGLSGSRFREGDAMTQAAIDEARIGEFMGRMAGYMTAVRWCSGACSERARPLARWRRSQDRRRSRYGYGCHPGWCGNGLTAKSPVA